MNEQGFVLVVDGFPWDVIVEGEAGSYSAFVPNLPGCVAAGETVEAALVDMQSLIREHLNGLDGA
jgi:predicted RNase H-like HicB family nuclease